MIWTALAVIALASRTGRGRAWKSRVYAPEHGGG